jgi:hypothetical protein
MKLQTRIKILIWVKTILKLRGVKSADVESVETVTIKAMRTVSIRSLANNKTMKAVKSDILADMTFKLAQEKVLETSVHRDHKAGTATIAGGLVVLLDKTRDLKKTL